MPYLWGIVLVMCAYDGPVAVVLWNATVITLIWSVDVAKKLCAAFELFETHYSLAQHAMLGETHYSLAQHAMLENLTMTWLVLNGVGVQETKGGVESEHP
jgi:hypothetical protein